MTAADTAPAVAPRRRHRPAPRHHGIVCLDKPTGMTSFAAVREVRRALGERRVGHAGTLDPMARGVLPVCVGAATRLVDYLHQQDKRYHCGIRLGERSDTMDLEGRVTPGATAASLDQAAVSAVLERFVGDIEQVPPMHSAVRHEGRHLYELAREGVEVDRAPRTVRIMAIRLIAFRPGAVAEAEVDVVCGKGAYMRVLADDIGAALGVGGLVAWLERTAYGPLTLERSVSVERLRALDDPASALLGPEVAVDHLPRVVVAPHAALAIRRGQAVWLPGSPTAHLAGTVRVHAADGRLLAVGELAGGHLRPTKVLAQPAD